MLLTVIDATGAPQTLVANAQGPVTDASGPIAAANVSQDVVVADATRSGFLFQNVSDTAMTVGDGTDATLAGAFAVAPGAYWPPAGYPAPVGSVTVACATLGKVFTAKSW